MIMLWTMPLIGETRQFVFFYQHRYPDLRKGFYIEDWCRDSNQCP